MNSLFFYLKISLLGVFLCSYSYKVYSQQTPPALDHMAFFYDIENDGVVLFGGSKVEDNRYAWHSDTWLWKNNEWENLGDTTPGTITSMTVAQMTSSGSVVMFGGLNPEKGDLNETWIWKDGKWKKYEGNSPSARLSPGMAYHPKSDRVILFSGCVGRNYPSDTWFWDGFLWTLLENEGPMEGLCRPSLFFDSNREEVLLFGGIDDSGKRHNDMWRLAGQKWKQVDQGAVRPSPRSNTMIAFDEHRKRAILYGGSTENGVSDDLWEWDGQKWNQIASINGPGPLEVYGITYHPGLKKVLIYGGRSSFAKPKDQLWSWDGDSWILISSKN